MEENILRKMDHCPLMKKNKEKRLIQISKYKKINKKKQVKIYE